MNGTTTVTRHTYHQCKSGQQRPGSREECRRCNPKTAIEHQIIARSAQRIALLEAVLQRTLLYLEHPEVTRIPFAAPSETLAKYIRQLLENKQE